MTIPQVHIYIGDKTITTTRMDAIPRMGEWILYEDCYFPVKDVFHGLDGRVYVICHETWHFIKDYTHYYQGDPISDKGVNRFKAAIQIQAALEKGDLKVATKEVNQDE